MAVAQNNKILHSDLKNWYDSFNSLPSSFGFSALTAPSSGAKAQPSDINNLQARITAFRSDTYLKTQLSLWPSGSDVSQGVAISASQVANIVTAAGNVSKVKCRNNANNTSGSYGHGVKGSGGKQNGNNNNIAKTHSACSCGTYTKDVCTNVGCTSGVQSNGDKSNTKHSNGVLSCSTYGNGTQTVSCQNGSCLGNYVGGGNIPVKTSGTESRGKNSKTYKDNVTRTCGTYNSGSKGNGKLSNSTRSNGTKTSNVVAGGGTQSGYCSNDSFNQNIKSNTALTCTSGNNSNGTHNNGLKSHGGTLQMCGSGAHSNQNHGKSDCSSGTQSHGTKGNNGGGSGTLISHANTPHGNVAQSYWINTITAVNVCKNGTNSCSTYSYTSKTCGTVIDILCASGTKSNG